VLPLDTGGVASANRTMSRSNEGDLLRIKRRLRRLFLSAVALLAISIGLTYWFGTVVVESGQRVTTEREVSQRLTELASTFAETETGQRGYLLTGEDKYLEPYDLGVAQVREELNRLERLAASGELPIEPVLRVHALAEQKLAEMADTIRARRERGLEAALAIVGTERGRQLSESIRAELLRLEADQQRDYQTASQRMGQAEVVRTLVFLATGVVTLGFLGWAYIRLSGETESREAAVHEAERQRALLATSEERFRLATEALTGLLYDWNLQTSTVLRSAGLKDLIGFRPEEAPETESWWLERIHPDDRAAVRERTQQLFAQKAPSFETEYRLINREGQTLYVSDKGRIVYDASGQPVRLVGSISDISARKQFQAELERQVAERTRSLQETTEQLNSFCYSVAHDLKAPLRAQTAFAGLLLEEFRGPLGPTGVSYAERIARAARQQGDLVEDLLAHMSVGRNDLPMGPVDLAKALAHARADLAGEEQQKGARVEVGSLDGPVLGNEASVYLVLVNLLSNALKFVASSAKPEVKLWTEPRADYVRLWVEDKGIGIEPKYLDKLFGVFQRLHPGAQYPGTGIGLAIVKRAVERMGGRVGVEAGASQGSRFWVELKKAT
jgi:PAS domain S-box-containing protein